MQVSPRTIAVWSDLGCPWAHAAVWRLHEARRRLGLTDAVRFEHHALPLELFNSAPTPRRELEAEWPVVAALAPRAGWRAWSSPAEAWPVTMLPPMEAVQAAAIQSPLAAEELDRGLRRAFWGESRCISLRHVILEVANACGGVDVAALAAVLDSGRARTRIFDDWEIAKGDEVAGSPHLFLPDGSSVQNPGVEMHWEGDDGQGGGFPVIDRDDPSTYDRIVRAAAS